MSLPLPTEPDALEGAPHPRLIAQLFGQTGPESEFLAAFATARLHHAWLISGPRGVGKATLAWKIARFLLSQPEDDGGMFAPAPPIWPPHWNKPAARCPRANRSRLPNWPAARLERRFGWPIWTGSRCTAR